MEQELKREWIDCPQAQAAGDETGKEQELSFRVMQWNTLADGMVYISAAVRRKLV